MIFGLLESCLFILYYYTEYILVQLNENTSLQNKLANKAKKISRSIYMKEHRTFCKIAYISLKF